MLSPTVADKIVIGGQEIEGPLRGNFNTPASVVNVVMSKLLVPLIAVILLLVFISGGYDFMLSRGNPEKIKTAQAKLTAAIIGFVILVSAYFVTKLISQIFGLV